MLRRLAIKNFRLLRDVTVDVEPGKPIVLIGPNSSGKSSVIHAMDLLGRSANEGIKEAFLAFGGSAAVVTVGPLKGARGATVETTTDTDDNAPIGTGMYPLRYGIELESYGLRQEWLHEYRDAAAPTHLMSRTDTGRFWILNSETHARDEQTPGNGARDKLSFELVKQGVLYPALGDLQSALASIRVYDGFLTTPLWVRDVREGRLSPFDSATLSPEPRIDRRGLNLINALYYLQSNHPDEWDSLNHAFISEFPFVSRIEFPADPAGGRLALGWRDHRYPGTRMFGHQMSEGMTSYLCLLAAIFSADPAAAIAFDEPDAHLHPSALRRVVHLLEELSKRSAVFVATHSDRFLDYLSDPAGSLRVCEPSDDGVTIRKLDRDVLDEWRRDYALSELRDRGQLDPKNSDASDP